MTSEGTSSEGVTGQTPQDGAAAPLPLRGVRVLDLSWVIAGPTCTRYLALMGAEVLKVESRRRPDPSRRQPIFQLLNQSKRGVAVNLAHPRGLALVRDLVRLCDVVVENFATGVIERLGLGYDELRRLRPDVVMLSSAGLGHTGPDRDHVAYGTLIQCFTGWAALQGYPGAPPLVGGVWTDPLVGTFQAYLVAAALHHRAATGEGVYVDLSMAEATTMLIPQALMDYAMNGRVRGPQANRDERYAPHNVYPCAGDDRWLAVAVTSDAQWQALCRVLGLEALAADPRFADGLGRWRHQEELDAAIARATRDQDAADLFHRLQGAGVPCGPSLDAADVAADPHLAARGFFAAYRDAQGKEVRLPALPWRITPGPAPVVEAAPELGAHQGEVLRELLGLTPEEVAELEREGALF